jgi:hypothetical protein
MTGKRAGDVDLAQKPFRGDAARLRIGRDHGDVEGHRAIDDGDGDPAIDGGGGGAHGETCHARIPPEHGGARLR